jgi:hypothetical protein
MSLVSGYLLTQKGSLLGKITSKKGDHFSSKWISIINSGELNVIFHPKYKRYQIDLISSEETTAFSVPQRKDKHQPHQSGHPMKQEYFGAG